MKILAIESSAKAASAALVENGIPVSMFFQSSSLTHSKTLLAMVDNLLSNLDMTISDVDAIAVASGPGSFTGVRIGVAAAKGLCWGAEKPIFSVSTLLAMAYQAARLMCVSTDSTGKTAEARTLALFPDASSTSVQKSESEKKTGSHFIICPVMDARRQQVYNAKFALSDGKPVRLTDDRAISVSTLIEEAKSDSVPYLLIGDGAALCSRIFADERVPAFTVSEPFVTQSALGVALAAESMEPCEACDVVPNYLRLSQAERERMEKNKLLNGGDKDV